MMKTKPWAIGLMLFCTSVTASAQISWKMGVANSLWYLILLGFFLYGFGALILLISLKHGELSVIYPIIALSFVWVNIFSPIFVATDSMNLTKWIGVVFVILGVSFIGGGSRQ